MVLQKFRIQKILLKYLYNILNRINNIYNMIKYYKENSNLILLKLELDKK